MQVSMEQAAEWVNGSETLLTNASQDYMELLQSVDGDEEQALETATVPGMFDLWLQSVKWYMAYAYEWEVEVPAVAGPTTYQLVQVMEDRPGRRPAVLGSFWLYSLGGELAGVLYTRERRGVPLCPFVDTAIVTELQQVGARGAFNYAFNRRLNREASGKRRGYRKQRVHRDDSGDWGDPFVAFDVGYKVRASKFARALWYIRQVMPGEKCQPTIRQVRAVVEWIARED